VIEIPSKKCELNLPNAKLKFYPNFLDHIQSDNLFKELLETVEWRHDKIKVFGKVYNQPRLTALYGKTGKPYNYSGITMFPYEFNDTLKALNTSINNISNHTFNTILLNLYRDGSDSNGWHADNEKELGENPIIASLSLGASRYFHFKHRTLKKHRYKILLANGSLLIMSKEMQHYWLHQIPKTKKHKEPRINLTFRYIN